MKKLLLFVASLMFVVSCNTLTSTKRHTKVGIIGNKFTINDNPTYKGMTWRGYSIEGLLPNSRMVNGIFDDETDSTRYRWIYPDTKVWDAERNVSEFIENMPLWREKGLLAFTINLQGGSPQGYSKNQPWCNTAIDPKGELKTEYMQRLERVLDRADELGMVAIVGLYYFGQEKYMEDEQAILNGIKNSITWILEKGYTNVLIEINNECNFYKNPILKPEGVHEAIAYAKGINIDGNRLLISTSYGGGRLPGEKVVAESDYILFHGNGVNNPDKLVELAENIKSLDSYRGQPLMINEDDHFDFDKPWNNFVAATSAGVSWGYFDYRKTGEPIEQGYQCIPADWGINTVRKQGFFNLLNEWGK